jgi:multiple antibiotic resistance protein
MEEFSFVFTILFMLLGPIKLIPSFGGLMQGADSRFKRDVAIRGVVIAAVLCAFVTLAGGSLLGKYRISIDAVRIAGGLVLLIAALQSIFQKSQPSCPRSGTPTALQLAAAPVAVPNIVPPAGVAAILLCMLLAPQYPGMLQAVATCLAIVLGLDFLVMWFIDRIVKTPGLGLVLTVLGAVLIFVQGSLAIQMMLNALKSLGVIKV